MPKAYLIARATVTDPEAWSKYAAAGGEVMKKFGGVPIARGGKSEVAEGNGRPRNVIIEFPSYEQAHAYAFGPEYAEVKKLRAGAGEIDIVIVEGA
ncbi:MAG: hypothetical protein RLZ98_735 [Pseudomonadota bacterium]|jgi:uncharacterized protein (DUF1330 family)